MIKQYRRNIQVNIELHEDLSYLQASVRVLMKGKGIEHPLRKTALTKILKALVDHADVSTLANLLK